MDAKLTPAPKRWLDFIADGGERGRMKLQSTASGGRLARHRAGRAPFVAVRFIA